MPKKRKLPDWLKTLFKYVEDTEAPRTYWLWSGLYTISAALQRKVWLPYGIYTIYPNLYVCLVARPGGRKGAPVVIAKKMLEDIYSPVAVDSCSKRSLTKELAKTAEKEQFEHPDGKPRRMSTLAIVSPEFGSLLAIDKENMIITLTDLWDCPDTWKYSTSDKGDDFLYNVCLGIFAAATPRYISKELPPEAFGEGFASRFVWVSERALYKSVPWPRELDKKTRSLLVHDLHAISQIVGEFKIAPEAREIFDTWYAKFGERKKSLRDERLHGSLNRLHIMALKVAMILKLSTSSELLIGENEVGRAIDFVEDCFATTSNAFGGAGYNPLSPFVEAVRTQLSVVKRTTFRELMQMNYRNITKSELKEILSTLEVMGQISQPISAAGEFEQEVIWLDRKVVL